MNKYNETDKILLLHQFITSGMDGKSFARSRNIPYTTFHDFCMEYGNADSILILDHMKRLHIPSTIDELQAQLAKEREEHERQCKEHEKELKALKKELEREKLCTLVNTTMIDLAERKFNIQIRKNSDAK